MNDKWDTGARLVWQVEKVPCVLCETGIGVIMQGDRLKDGKHQRVKPAENGGLFCAKCFVSRLNAETN